MAPAHRGSSGDNDNDVKCVDENENEEVGENGNFSDGNLGALFANESPVLVVSHPPPRHNSTQADSDQFETILLSQKEVC